MAPRIELDSGSAGTVDGRQIRAVAFQDVRMEYVTRVATPAAGSRALVVGSGRGLLARGLGRLGFDVVAVDPSAKATAIARHASEDVVHETAPAERLSHQDAVFDLVYCADTLEITADLDGVLAEAARVLKPGGLFVYDTVNRTLLSRLIYLGVFQRLPLTRIMPPHRYTSARLRTPAELTGKLRLHGLRNEGICGFKPKNAPSLVKAVLARRRGEIADEEIPAIVEFVLTPDESPLVTYLGYARKLP